MVYDIHFDKVLNFYSQCQVKGFVYSTFTALIDYNVTVQTKMVDCTKYY